MKYTSYKKEHNKRKREKKKKTACGKKTSLPLNKQSIYKLNQNKSMVLYVHLHQIHKHKQKGRFNDLIRIYWSSPPWLPPTF